MLKVTTFLFLMLLNTLHSNPMIRQNRVILVSFDGFRHDYLLRYNLPTFQRVASHGVFSRTGLSNVFTTLTFPSHVSMSTGLYQENHGIVSNKFFDRQLNETFYAFDGKATFDNKWWKSAEPIWITTTKAGIPSGTVFWPGSEVDYNGVWQKKYLRYNNSLTFESRVDIAMEWMEKEGLRFVTLYFDEPDFTGHNVGADSDKIFAGLQKVDLALCYLLQRLEATSLLSSTDVVIVSDHGMSTVTSDDGVTLAELQAAASAAFTPWPDFHARAENSIYSDAMLTFNLRRDGNDAANAEFLRRLQLLEQRHLKPHYSVYLREQMPQRWHYSGNMNRVADVMILAEPGHGIYHDQNKKWLMAHNVFGVHGYDNKYPEMRPLFMMIGPSLTMTPRQVNSIHQVDLYGLICRLLHVPPHWQHPHNGSWERIEAVITGCALPC